MHFMLRGSDVVGLTPTGRATVALLQMNTARRLERRAELIAWVGSNHAPRLRPNPLPLIITQFQQVHDFTALH